MPTPPPADGSELLADYQAGSIDALRQLVVRYALPVYCFFWSMLADAALAETLSRSFWLAVHRQRHSYRRGQPLVPWLYGLAVQLRRDQTRQPVVHASQPGAARAIDDAESLLRALRDLPDSYREVVVLESIVGLSQKDTALVLHASEAAVQARAEQGYQQLGQSDPTLPPSSQQESGRQAVRPALLGAAMSPTAIEHTIRDLLPLAARDLQRPPRPWLLLGTLILVISFLAGLGIGWLAQPP